MPQKQQEQEERPPNDILQVLMDMRSGAVAADISRKFDEMIKAVIDVGAKGELTITLTAEPSKRGMGGAVLEVQAEHKCKVKKPELEIGKSLFFVTRDGRLTRDDPNQSPLFASGEPEQKERLSQ